MSTCSPLSASSPFATTPSSSSMKQEPASVASVAAAEGEESEPTTSSTESGGGGQEPSTSQEYPNHQQMTNDETSNSSPALARSVPSSYEATSPSEQAIGPQPAAQQPPQQQQQFYYFTTEMANRAMQDIEREKDKFDTLLKWIQYHKDDEMVALGASRGNSTSSESSGSSGSAPPKDKENTTPGPGSSQPSSNSALLQSTSGFDGFPYSPHLPGLGDGGPGSAGPTIGKEEHVELDDISPTLLDVDMAASSSNNVGGSKSLKRKLETDPEENVDEMVKMAKHENPLRRLEMMSAAQHFSATSQINDIAVTDPGTSMNPGSVGSVKKDERAIKLEKLEDIRKSVEEEQREMHMKKMATMYQQSPGQYPPMYPHPHPHPHHLPPHPAAAGGPFSAGPSPYGPPPPPWAQRGVPGAPYSSPSYPGAPPRPPPHPMMMNPHHPAMHPHHPHHQYYAAQMQAHQMAYAQAVAAGKNGGAPSPSQQQQAKQSPAAQSPFGGAQAQAQAAAYHHHMMMMRHHHHHHGMQPMPPMGSPYGYPPGVGGAPPPPPNSMLMVARNGLPPMGGVGGEMSQTQPFGGTTNGWAPQLTPHYPPSFPPAVATTPGARVNSTPSAAATPNK